MAQSTEVHQGEVAHPMVPSRPELPPNEEHIDEKIEAIQVEVAADHLNVVDFELLSRESIKFKSRATLRLLAVIVIQGISEFNSVASLLLKSALTV